MPTPTKSLTDRFVPNVASARVLSAADLASADWVEAPWGGSARPDLWKTFMEIEICKSWPAITGPTMQGRYLSYMPEVLWRSFESLLFQQMNLQHELKFYGAQADRIVGTVAASRFPYPSEGIGGWDISDITKAPSMRILASVFMMADGAEQMLREHVSGARRWSVSIEVTSPYEKCGVLDTSAEFTHENVRNYIYPLLNPPQHLKPFIKFGDDGELTLGAPNGKPLVLMYGGLNDAVEMRGVGFTPTPAERTAQIMAVEMARQKQQVDEMARADRSRRNKGVVALHASRLAEPGVVGALCSLEGQAGQIEKVWTAGPARLPGLTWHMAASSARPVCQIRLGDGRRVLRSLASLRF